MRYSLVPSATELYATCVVCISSFLCGVDMTFSAGLSSQMSNMSISLEEQSLIGSINMYARALSGLFITYFLNKLGRKNSLLLILSLNIIAWVLMYFFSFSMAVVYISRAFSGFAAGMRTPITLYITETANKSRRGILISFFGLTLSLGITATYIIQYLSSWRMVAFISLVISVIGFIQTCFLKETKYWHLYKNNVEKAKESIKWFDNSLTESEIQAEIDEILSTDNQLNNRQVNVIAAFKNRTNLKYFTFGFLLLTFIYGCGRVQITAHPHNYYNQFQLPVDNSVITLIQGILELIMSVFYTLIVDTVPRKTMLRCCCGLMNACLMVALFHDILATSCGLIGQWILLVVLMVFYGVSCGFLFSLTTIMVSEIVSVTTEARAVFQSLLYVWVNLISGVYSEVFPFALEAIPVNYIILFFFINVALLLLTGFLVPETRGKALHLCSAGKETKVSNKNTNSATEKV